MKDILRFMGNHPVLTFFLAVILVNGIVVLVRGHEKTDE